LRFQPGGIAWTHTVRGRDIRPLSGAGPGHRAAAEFIGSADGTGAPRLGNTLPLGRAPPSLNSGAVAVGSWSVGEGDGVGWRRGTGGGRRQPPPSPSPTDHEPTATAPEFSEGGA